MISRFNYKSPTVQCLLLDISNYGNVDSIDSEQQNWIINGTNVNDSVVVIKKMLNLAENKRYEDAIHTLIWSSFMQASVDSQTVQLDEEGKIFFSFKNGFLKIIAKDNSFHYVFKNPNCALNSKDFTDKDIWQRFLATLKAIY